MEPLTPDELLGNVVNEFNNEVRGLINTDTAGVTEKESHEVWMRSPRDKIREVVNYLRQIQTPHFVTMLGIDRGEDILVKYVMSLFYDEKFREITVVMCVEVPKDDLWLPSISDLIKGSLTSEREIHEMLGIEIKDIPDDRHFFLPFDHPEEEYPWRRDERRIDIKDVYEKEGQQ